MSKKRKMMNAQHWPVKSAGVTISSTSQNATISSHTTGDGSSMPSLLAVKPQMPMPATKPTAIRMPHSMTVSLALNAANDAHANSVPTVPGAMGDRPLPKPSDRICKGCDSMKRAVARRGRGARGWPCGAPFDVAPVLPLDVPPDDGSDCPPGGASEKLPAGPSEDS